MDDNMAAEMKKKLLKYEQLKSRARACQDFAGLLKSGQIIDIRLFSGDVVIVDPDAQSFVLDVPQVKELPVLLYSLLAQQATKIENEISDLV